MSSVYGSFNGGRIFSSFSLSVPTRGVAAIFNPDNDNGSALLGVVNLLRGFRSKAIHLFNEEVPKASDEGTVLLHHGRVSFLFRGFKLVRDHAVERGLLVNLRCSRLDAGRGGVQVLRTLRRAKLSGPLGARMCGLSNKRRRQITLTHILLGPSELILTSRPAKSLSSEGESFIVGEVSTLGSYNGAIVIISRSSGFERVDSGIVFLHP